MPLDAAMILFQSTDLICQSEGVSDLSELQLEAVLDVSSMSYVIKGKKYWHTPGGCVAIRQLDLGSYIPIMNITP